MRFIEWLLVRFAEKCNPKKKGRPMSKSPEAAEQQGYEVCEQETKAGRTVAYKTGQQLAKEKESKSLTKEARQKSGLKQRGRLSKANKDKLSKLVEELRGLTAKKESVDDGLPRGGADKLSSKEKAISRMKSGKEWYEYSHDDILYYFGHGEPTYNREWKIKHDKDINERFPRSAQINMIMLNLDNDIKKRLQEEGFFEYLRIDRLNDGEQRYGFKDNIEDADKKAIIDIINYVADGGNLSGTSFIITKNPLNFNIQEAPRFIEIKKQLIQTMTGIDDSMITSLALLNLTAESNNINDVHKDSSGLLLSIFRENKELLNGRGFSHPLYKKYDVTRQIGELGIKIENGFYDIYNLRSLGIDKPTARKYKKEIISLSKRIMDDAPNGREVETEIKKMIKDKKINKRKKQDDT